MPDLAILATGLRKVYDDLTAVDGVDLAVKTGEIYGLLGPNGAGKTTTIGMLTTRVTPTAGQIAVHGVDVVAEPARAKAALGVVPQTNTLDRDLTVADNLRFHGRYFGMSRRETTARTDELITRFRLSDKADVKVDTLSGGLAQRVMLARAVLHRPAVLFLDEPTTGLDPQARMALWELLGEVNAAGQTILITTHYMEEADVLCDRVAIMDGGQILAEATPAVLKDRVDAGAVIDLTLDAPDGDGALVTLAERLAGEVGARSGHARTGGITITAGSAAGLLPRLLASLDRDGIMVRDVSVHEPTLETVFIELTGKELRE